MRIKTNIKGETILEIIVALTILATGISFASSIIGSSIQNINNAKNRIIAVNIAREGIEAIKNIRDTNWLKYSHKQRNCWNHDPRVETCDGITQIMPGEYIVYKQNVSKKWMIDSLEYNSSDDEYNRLPEAPDGPGPLIYRDTSKNKTFRWVDDQWKNMAILHTVDIDKLTDSDLDHNYQNDQDIYNHILTEVPDDALGWDEELGWELTKQTIFARTILIEYLDNEGNPVSTRADWDAIVPAINTANLNRMRITSTVNWMSGKSEFTSKLSTHITDYLNRETIIDEE